jgi:hypothetical protein
MLTVILSERNKSKNLHSVALSKMKVLRYVLDDGA